MGMMERILRLMGEKQASDVYLSAGAPALIRIHGECVPINNQLLPPNAPRDLLAEIVPPERMEELEETGELNMGVPLVGVGRFRISAMHQRGTCAVVIRFITQQIPELASLHLPPGVGRSGLAKAWPRAGGGRHRLGQEHHARSHARQAQPRAFGPHPHGGRPDRIPVQEQKIHRQPARGGHGHAVAASRAQKLRCARRPT